MLNPAELSYKEINYTAISSTPVTCFSIKKLDFYEYVDDKTRKQFMNNMRRYHTDFDLRSEYYELHTWNQFKVGYLDKHVKIPMQISSDKKMMQEIELNDAANENRRNKIILPKINKKAQNT